ncbi:MAG: hypothetical protein K2Q18_16580, partial [Bdellovibrionales bacterium]|nr:hypothetical protein [Bdellovibrionales bacterium]
AFNERTLISPNTLMLIVSDVENRMARYAAFFVFIALSFFGVKTYRKKKGEQMVKEFYTLLFTLSKKANIQLKVFGKLTSSEAKLIKGIQLPFLNSLYLSRAVANKSEVRFKTKKNNIVSIEVNYLSSRSIQNVMSLPKESAFKESMEKLQIGIESIGGEFVISNRFNSFGELIQSSMLIHLPKV